VESQNETALLGFAKNVHGMASLAQERTRAQTVQMLLFDSGREFMGTVQKHPNGTYL
jgi:Ca2+-transporting ATPase